METILRIKTITTKLGRNLILVQTAKRDHFITVGQWNAAGLSHTYELYVNGSFTGDYAKKGEPIFTPVGQAQRHAEADDVILLDFVVEADAKKVAMAYAAETAIKAQELTNKDLLFRRKRDAVQAGAISAAAEVNTSTGEVSEPEVTEQPEGQEA